MVSTSLSRNICQVYDFNLPDSEAEKARDRILHLCKQKHHAFIRKKVDYSENLFQRSLWKMKTDLYQSELLSLFKTERQILAKMSRSYEDPVRRLKKLREQYFLFARSAPEKATEYANYLLMLMDFEKNVLQHSQKHLTACRILHQIDGEEYRHDIEVMKRELDVVDPQESMLRCIRYKGKWNIKDKSTILLALSILSGFSIDERIDIEQFILHLEGILSATRLQKMLSSSLPQVKMIARKVDLAKRQIPRLKEFNELDYQTGALILKLQGLGQSYDQRMASKGFNTFEMLSGSEVLMLATPHLFNLIKAHLELRVKACEGLASIGCFAYNTLGRCLFDRSFMRNIQATHRVIKQQRRREASTLCLYAMKWLQQIGDQKNPLLIHLIQQTLQGAKPYFALREIHKLYRATPIPLSVTTMTSVIDHPSIEEEIRPERKEEKVEKSFTKPGQKDSNSSISTSSSSSSSSLAEIEDGTNSSWTVVKGFEYHSRVKRWERLKRKSGDKIPFAGYEKLTAARADRAYLSHHLPSTIETLLFDPNFCLRRSVKESDDGRERFHLIAGMSYRGEDFRLGIVTYSIIRKGMRKVCIHRHFSEQPNGKVINKESREKLLDIIDEQLDKELTEESIVDRESSVGDAEVALEYIELPPDPAFDFKSFYCSQYDTKITVFPQQLK